MNLSNIKSLSTTIIGLCLPLLILTGCNKKIDLNPKGTVSGTQINTPSGAENMVIAAYAQLGNDHYDQPF